MPGTSNPSGRSSEPVQSRLIPMMPPPPNPLVPLSPAAMLFPECDGQYDPWSIQKDSNTLVYTRSLVHHPSGKRELEVWVECGADNGDAAAFSWMENGANSPIEKPNPHEKAATEPRCSLNKMILFRADYLRRRSISARPPRPSSAVELGSGTTLSCRSDWGSNVPVKVENETASNCPSMPRSLNPVRPK